MNVDWSIVAQIAAPIITLFIGVLINHLMESRPKVVSYLGFIATHHLLHEENRITINTHSIVIRNAGRKAANNVRLRHSILTNFNIFPDIDYKVNNLPGGNKEIVFPILTPKKEIIVNYLYFPPLVWTQFNTFCESDDGPAKVVKVLLQPEVKLWLKRLIWFFIVLGVIAFIYLMYSVVFWGFSGSTN